MYMKFPSRYLPAQLTARDTKKQVRMLLQSKRLYKKHRYYTRKRLPSYKNQTSKHIRNAQNIYNVSKIIPNNMLAKRTGCSLSALKQIVRKGEGAYYSSGSRPNQTSQSWGMARLASAITAGKAAAIDYNILDKGCNHKKKAFLLANKSRKKYKYGHSKTRKVTI